MNLEIVECVLDVRLYPKEQFPQWEDCTAVRVALCLKTAEGLILWLEEPLLSKVSSLRYHHPEEQQHRPALKERCIKEAMEKLRGIHPQLADMVKSG